MSGLILKDLYNIRKQAIWYVAMIILFSVLSIVLKNAAFAYAIGILVTISIPLAAIAYEEKDGWQKFAIASGMDIKTIVGEKIFLGVVFAIIGSVAYTIVVVIIGTEENRVTELIASICMQLLMLAAVLPIVFRFGAEKGRTYMIAAVVVLLAVFIAVMPLSGRIVGDEEIIFAVCMIFFAVLSVCISLFISIRIYKAKEF